MTQKRFIVTMKLRIVIMSKVFKAILTAWFINLIVFTASLFIYQYYEHIDSWLAYPWRIVFDTSIISKITLSIVVIGYGCTNGVYGKGTDKQE